MRYRSKRKKTGYKAFRRGRKTKKINRPVLSRGGFRL